MNGAGRDESSRPGTRLTIGTLMLLIVGIGMGLAMSVPILSDDSTFSNVILVGGGGMLGGASVVGVPLLLWERWRGDRRRRSTRFGPGRLSWFAHGTAAWLLWPPIIVGRGDNTSARVCYFYGTPLMAVYMTAALLAGGWLGRRRRLRSRRDWRERFGLLLGLGWAALGLYLLAMIYADDFR